MFFSAGVNLQKNFDLFREYRENIEVIDKGVKEIEELISEFYNNDNRTAFVYTSDHGMTDWGKEVFVSCNLCAVLKVVVFLTPFFI